MIAPDEGQVRTFAVRVDAGRVLLQRDALRSLCHPERERGISICAERDSSPGLDPGSE
jgi:hypothetical protein